MPMSKKTYEAVAQVLNTELLQGGDEATIASVTDRMAKVFEDDNWAFQRDLFIKAAMTRPVAEVPEGQQHVTVLCRIAGCSNPALYEGPHKSGNRGWTQVCHSHRWRILVQNRRPAPGIGGR